MKQILGFTFTTLVVPEDTSAALIGYMIQSIRLGLDKLMATYSR